MAREDETSPLTGGVSPRNVSIDIPSAPPMNDTLLEARETLENGVVSAKIPKAANGAAPPQGQGRFVPPDGGARAWLVLVGSFFCNGILFGVINSYSVMYNEIHDSLARRNDTAASSKAALVGSLAMGTTFFMSPVSGVLTDRYGIRATTLAGGAVASSGLLLSSFWPEQVSALCITFGVMYGFGGSLAYTPSLAVLGHYFRRYLGIVNGVVAIGSPLFTVAMPYIMDAAIKQWGLKWSLRVLAVIASGLMGCAILFKPLQKDEKASRATFMDLFNKRVLSNRRYIIWATTIAISLFGYFVPYVYMLKFVEQNFPDHRRYDKVPVLCIAITSGIGRPIFGYIADQPRVNRVYLQLISLLSIGVLTMVLPFSAGNFPLLVVLSLGMGVFDGCFITMLGPVAFEICGKEGATQAIGFLLGLCSVPLTIGPYVAGKIYDAGQSYTLPFVLTGLPPALGAVFMVIAKCFLERGASKTQTTIVEATQPLKVTKPVHDRGATDSKEEDGPL